MQILTLLGAGLAAAGGQFGITAAYYHAPAKEISDVYKRQDISDGFEKGNGKICEQQTFEFFASGDCCDCNRAEYSIAFCIGRKNRIRRKKNQMCIRDRVHSLPNVRLS